MNRPFLTARWSNILLATYSVPPALLMPRLPSGLQLDLRDEQAFISLVGFQFVETRVRGVPWPGFRTFPELNLRFYVRDGIERGVVFIREFVSSRAIAWLARFLYNEPYRAAPLAASVREVGESLTVEYRLLFGGRTHSLAMTAINRAYRPASDTQEHFFKEHRWGYGMSRRRALVRFEVSHDVWNIYPVQTSRVDFDWGMVYGPEWEFLAETAPISTVSAVGSFVAVYPASRHAVAC
jgi:uncharacterized protein YqjF (DUF2071 family)